MPSPKTNKVEMAFYIDGLFVVRDARNGRAVIGSQARNRDTKYAGTSALGQTPSSRDSPLRKFRSGSARATCNSIGYLVFSMFFFFFSY